jgi:hypothetical protein
MYEILQKIYRKRGKIKIPLNKLNRLDGDVCSTFYKRGDSFSSLIR